ncbi:hypothetical protein SAMN05216369_0489 [Marinobacter antarcticus]|uniref:Uncharacterized protein n=1 Tax=Marinobacter antarcticus TaxID=564117 RepID=A0A1M6PTP4_9GAMM|nr:hypothetical protein SAMN05216369_0489 [Marinobacter antarcticus]
MSFLPGKMSERSELFFPEEKTSPSSVHCVEAELG